MVRLWKTQLLINSNRQEATALTNLPAASATGRGPRPLLTVALSTEVPFHMPTTRPLLCHHLLRGFSSRRSCRGREITGLSSNRRLGVWEWNTAAQREKWQRTQTHIPGCAEINVLTIIRDPQFSTLHLSQETPSYFNRFSCTKLWLGYYWHLKMTTDNHNINTGLDENSHFVKRTLQNLFTGKLLILLALNDFFKN